MAALPEPFSHTAVAMDEAIVAKARNGDSMGVPMSSVANPCERALWYAFRWASPAEKAEGKQQRRFRTGHQYERWLLDDLRAIGCDVAEIDEATGKQIAVELAGGHLRGKIDGRAVGLPEAPAAVHVVECKSHNDRSFKELQKKGLREGKPDHFAQIQLYMHGTGIYRSVYAAANKNDDAIHVERVPYDPAFCLALVARIERIVASPRPPARLYDDPTSKAAFACQWCPARTLCHEGASARRTCRTCMFSTPGDGPRWICERHACPLSYREMQEGCAGHLYIPELVAGDQIDADPKAGTVTYRMQDGAVWVDGAGSGRAG